MDFAMEYHQAENVNSAYLNNCDIAAPNTGYTNSERAQRGVNGYPLNVVRVANCEIGRVLAAKPPKSEKRWAEASKSRGYAIRELFMKAQGERKNTSGYAANLKRQDRAYGVSEWQYRQQRHFAKRALGNHGRRQDCYKDGDVYASERPLAPLDGGYVEMPLWAVKELPPKTFAFIVVTLLRREPCRPRDIAAQIGLVDDQVVAKLAKEGADTQLIKRHVGARRTVWVGRPNADFSALDRGNDLPILHHPEKHHPEKQPAHIDCKEGRNLSSSSSGTLGESERTGKVWEDSRCRDVREPLTSPGDKIILWNWRTPRRGEPLWYWHEFYSDGFQRPSEVELEAAPLSHWRDTVERLGPVSDHLRDAWAHEQAIDIARELLHELGHNLEHDDVIRCWLPLAVRGLAGEIASHLRDGGEIKNLNFLASRLLARCEQSDDSWMYSLPSRISEDDFAWVRRHGERLAIYARECGHPLDYREMTGTLGLEELHDMLLRLGSGDREVGWKIMVTAIDRSAMPAKGRQWIRWTAFESEAEKARRQQLLDQAEDTTGHVQLVAIARTCGHRIDETELSSPAGLQDLNDLLTRLGNGDPEAGLRYLVRGIKKAAPLPEDKVVIRWTWFEREANAALRRSLAARRAAETRASRESALGRWCY